MLTFVARIRSSPEIATVQMIVEAQYAFEISYLLQTSADCIEFKCIQMDFACKDIPGTPYLPDKLVQSFNYTKE